MQDKISHFTYKEKQYPLVFNLNVMEEIQEHYGSMNEWAELVEGDNEPKIKDLKFGIMAMINEAIDIENEEKEEKTPFFTSKQIGRVITEVGFIEFIKMIKELTIQSTKVDDEIKNV